MKAHLLVFLFAAACTPDPVDSDTDTDSPADTDATPVACADATTTGSLALSLAMEEDYIPSMDEDPIGTFRASVFRGEDVSGIGPVDGAVALADIEVADVDLTDGGGPVDLAHTVADLPACRVAILGCLDSDGNDCDQHDAITLPNDNMFVVIEGTATPVQVFLGLLNPS
jgi:hypothetical protein